jgi:hypothetical protein
MILQKKKKNEEEQEKNSEKEEKKPKKRKSKSTSKSSTLKKKKSILSSTLSSTSISTLKDNNPFSDYNIFENIFSNFFQVFKFSIQKPENIFSSFVIERWASEKNSKKILEQLLLFPSFIQKKYSKELVGISLSYFNSKEFTETQIKPFLLLFDLFHLDKNKNKFFKKLEEERVKAKRINPTKLNRDQVKN